MVSNNRDYPHFHWLLWRGPLKPIWLSRIWTCPKDLMKNGWVLQKGFKLWPRSHLAQLSMEEAASSKGKQQMKQGVLQKVAHYLSSERWATKASGVFWLQDTRGSFTHCKPGSVWSFSPGRKAMRRRASSCRSTTSLWPDLPWGVILCNPTAVCGVQLLKPSFYRPTSEALWKLEPEPSCKPANWWVVPQRNC